MDYVVIGLAIAVTVQALVIAGLGFSWPMMWWKCLKQEKKIEALDETVAGILEVMQSKGK